MQKNKYTNPIFLCVIRQIKLMTIPYLSPSLSLVVRKHITRRHHATNKTKREAQAIIIPIFKVQIKNNKGNNDTCGITMRNGDDVMCQKWVVSWARSFVRATDVHISMQVAPSGTACKRIYESTYALPVGRKRRAASAMRRWTSACPAWSVSHLLYLNTAGAILSPARRAEYEISSRLADPPVTPRRPAVRKTPCVIRVKATRDGDNSTKLFTPIKYLSLPPRAGSIDVSIPQQRCYRLSHGKFDNFQPFAPARTWAQLWLMILPRQTHSVSLFSCVTSYPPCTIRRY